MRNVICPECGCPLSVEVVQDENTETIMVNLFCEGYANDIYSIKINTHLNNKELQMWDRVGSTREATMSLEKRTRDPYATYELSKIELERYQEK